MEVPRFAWPDAPWSPVGYQIVVTDESPPWAEVEPLPDCSPESLPWAMPGYRIVEGVEESDPRPPRHQPRARSAKASRPQKGRRLGRWSAVMGIGTVLLAASIVLVSQRLSASSRGIAGGMAAKNDQASQARCAPGDCRAGPRETFGTSVEFVRSHAEASRLAAHEQKLVFLLHVSGNFDDPGLT